MSYSNHGRYYDEMDRAAADAPAETPIDTDPLIRLLVNAATVAHVLMTPRGDGSSDVAIICPPCAARYIRPARITADELNNIILQTGRGQTCERCSKEIR